MCYDRIFAVYDLGVITTLVKHTRINTEYGREVDCSVKSTFIRADHDHMILIDDQILLVTEQRTDELVRRCKIIEALQWCRILDTRIVGIKRNEVGNTHFTQLFECISAVKRFTAASFMLSAFI